MEPAIEEGVSDDAPLDIEQETPFDAPLIIERSAADYDAALSSAMSALRAAHARVGARLSAGEVSRVARRFDLDGIQVAEVEARGEAEGLLESAAPPADPLVEEAGATAEQKTTADIDLLGILRKDIGAVHFLKPADEIAFGDAIIAGTRAEASLSDANLTDDQLSRLNAAVANGRAARDEFWRCNTPLALHIALRFQNMGLEYLDLVQSGLIGLMRAIEKWDPHRGYRFSTYAFWWIEQQIRRALADEGRTIRLPVHVVDTILRIRKVRRQLFTHLGREPQLEELSDSLGIERAKLALYLDLEEEPLSLDLIVGEKQDSTIGQFVKSKNVDEYPEFRVLADERTERLNAHLASLTKRQRSVISLRFGLGEEQRPKTLQEIGDDMGVTRERVRQIEAKALRILSQRMASKTDREFFA